jgi:hypothetical protein
LADNVAVMGNFRLGTGTGRVDGVFARWLHTLRLRDELIGLGLRIALGLLRLLLSLCGIRLGVLAPITAIKSRNDNVMSSEILTRIMLQYTPPAAAARAPTMKTVLEAPPSLAISFSFASGFGAAGGTVCLLAELVAMRLAAAADERETTRIAWARIMFETMDDKRLRYWW